MKASIRSVNVLSTRTTERNGFEAYGIEVQYMEDAFGRICQQRTEKIEN